MNILFVLSTLNKFTHGVVEMKGDSKLEDELSSQVIAAVEWAKDQSVSLNELVITIRFSEDG